MHFLSQSLEKALDNVMLREFSFLILLSWTSGPRTILTPRMNVTDVVFGERS